MTTYRTDYPAWQTMHGDGVRVGKEPTGGEPARQRRLRARLLRDGERTYRCYSADELIEIDSLAHEGPIG